MYNLADELTFNEPNSLLISIILILFFALCYCFVAIGKRNELKRIEYIKELLDTDPSFKVEYRYFINMNTSDFIIEDKMKLRSMINIVCYFLIFFVITSLISGFILGIYTGINDITLEELLANEELYNKMNTELTPILELIVYSLGLIVAFVFLGKSLFSDIKGFKKDTFKTGLWGILFIYAGSIIGSIILAILGLVDDSSNEQAIGQILSSAQSTLGIIIMAVVIVIMAPILEELVFRKSFFNICGNDNRKGLIISSLAFALMHVIDPTVEAIVNLASGGTYLDIVSELAYVIIYFLMGCGLGLCYIKSKRNICSSIIAHMVNNLLSFLLTLGGLGFIHLF